jgi:hypothetical protein
VSQQSTAEPRRPDPAAAADELTRPVRVPPAPPTRMVGNFVVTPPTPAEPPAPAEASSPTEAPSPTEPPAVAGPPTTLMPALPPVAGSGPAAAQARPTAERAPAPETPAPEPEPAALTADQPTVHLPGGTGRPEDAATVTWLAGPGPGPLQYPRVVPRRHPVRRLLFVLLLLAVAAVVAAFLLT